MWPDDMGLMRAYTAAVIAIVVLQYMKTEMTSTITCSAGSLKESPSDAHGFSVHRRNGSGS